MNDTYLSNGKTGHWRELGLPKPTKVQANWPTPEQIKLNATKRDTVPVAFRMDEVAYAMLNLFAEQCDLTTSAFLNELINSYIEQNRHNVAGSVFYSAINLSVERVASKIKKMSVEQAILNYHQDALRYAIEMLLSIKLDKNDTGFCNLGEMKKILEAGHYMYLRSSFLDCCIDLTLKDEAVLSDYREASPEELNTVNFNSFALDIPYRKWVYVEPILGQYSTKCEQFLRTEEYKDLTQDERIYEGIAEIINTYDGAELVEKITERLKFKGGKWLNILQC